MSLWEMYRGSNLIFKFLNINMYLYLVQSSHSGTKATRLSKLNLYYCRYQLVCTHVLIIAMYYIYKVKLHRVVDKVDTVVLPG